MKVNQKIGARHRGLVGNNNNPSRKTGRSQKGLGEQEESATQTFLILKDEQLLLFESQKLCRVPLITKFSPPEALFISLNIMGAIWTL